MSQAGLFAQLPQLRLGETEQSCSSIFINLVSNRLGNHRTSA